MVKASPFVIKNISMVLKKRDFVEAKQLLEKFSARYSEDTQLLKICKQYTEYLETQELGKIEEVKRCLNRLKNSRKSGTLEATGLWFNNRRPNTMQVIQVT
ncbi:MAG: hypothetical protein JW778_04200 [Candidatus Altiarchaeota archaeon]|nr:hypothetical protein [Candidatus Altiarchaeota archaeon]